MSAATFRVLAGLSRETGLANLQVLLVGRQSALERATFGGDLARKLHFVREDAWNAARERLKSAKTVPIHADLVSFIAVSDDVSRHNAPSNAIALARELRGFKAAAGIKKLHIVLYAQYAHVFASVASIVRSFPTFTRKTKKSDLEEIQLEIVVTDEKELKQEDVQFLQALADSMRTCAHHVDMPCSELNTTAFVAEAVRLIDALNAGVTKTIITGEELLKRGFGGVYHVGKAAKHPPAFAAFTYSSEGAEKTGGYALVGKGIVFDTGGMQIKGKTAMPSMKIDMGGAAAQLGAFCTLVRSGFRGTLHCILCIAENSISPEASRPDDIITMLSGKKVEINNTDAEGRLVLADGVYYAAETLKAQTIIDMATLTGAQKQFSGNCMAAIVSNKEDVERDIVAAGRKSGELTHPMPYTPDLYFSDLKSPVADMKNSNLGSPDGPPSLIAALFIAAQLDFTDRLEWLHIDIVGPAIARERGTAFGVALMCAYFAKHLNAGVCQQA